MKTAEQILRERVVSTICKWEGAARGSATHKKILEIYNNHAPLARGYKVQVKDAWCATTVSAVWILCGISNYTGTECSCNNLIAIAKQKGYWQENDAYIPKIGDALLYDWDDDGIGDDTDPAEHIGIVIEVNGNQFIIMEGNKGNASVVGKRAMKINGRYIRGFITPDYATIANSIGVQGEKEEQKMTYEDFKAYMDRYLKELAEKDADWEAKAMEWGKKNGLMHGDAQGRLMPKKFITRGELMTVLARKDGQKV